MRCPNVPPNIAAVLIRRPEMLHGLQTIYGTEDLYNLLEVMAVDAHNQRLIAQRKS